MRRSRAGDRSALGELLRFYQPRVFGLVRRYVARRDEAVEVTQESFLQTLKTIDRFAEGRPFRPWLFKIALNVCRNYRRCGQRRECPQTEMSEDELLWQAPLIRPDEHLVAAEQGQRLAHMLARLPPDDRALLLLRYNEQMPYADLAAVFHRPEGLLKMRVHRALKRLRALLEEGCDETA